MFEVIRFENLAPTTVEDIWAADVVLDLEDSIDGEALGQVVRLTVRFRVQGKGSADELLQSAYGQAKRVLASASETIAAQPFEIMWRDRQNRSRE